MIRLRVNAPRGHITKIPLNLSSLPPSDSVIRKIKFAIVNGGNIAEYLTITFRRQLADTDLTYTTEFSENLESWDPNIALQAPSSNNGDGTATEVWRAPLPTSTESHWFTRLRVTN